MLLLCAQGSQLMVAYDEHEVNNTFKFGVIYQKFGQVSGGVDLASELRFNPNSSLDLSHPPIVSLISIYRALLFHISLFPDIRGGAVWEQRGDASF